MIMKKLFYFILIGLLAGCKPNDVDVERKLPDFSRFRPEVTPRGNSLGAPRTAQIGPSGGELRSEDGRLTVNIPAGALSNTVTVGIEPISNHCPLGLGTGYRLTPEGVTFAKPVKLTFGYDNTMLKGSAAEFLWITTQKADGTWVGDLRSEPDASTRTVSTETTHFSDWTLGKMIDLALEPSTSVVKVGNSVDIMIVGFLSREFIDDDLVPLAPINHGNMSDDDLVPLNEAGNIMLRLNKYQQLIFKDWRLDGTKAPVSNSKGKLQVDDNAIDVTYTAPGKKPNPDNVSVSVTIEARFNGGKAPANITINAPITITDREYYAKFNIDGKEFNYYTTFEFTTSEAPEGEGTVGGVYTSNEMVFGIGKADKKNPALDHALSAHIKNPVIGTNAIPCQLNGFSNVTFGWAAELKKYENINYNWRPDPGWPCQQNRTCTSVTLTIKEIKPGPQSTILITGTMSGTLVYNNNDNNRDCNSKESVSFSGEFYLPFIGSL